MDPMVRNKKNKGEGQEQGSRSEIPLTPAVFGILLCLVEGDKHGYAIMKEVAARTDGHLQFGPGTLYGCIQRMITAGLIRECTDVRPTPGEIERKRYYSITPYGKQVASSEAQRMSGLVRLARRLRLIPRTTT